jgi:multidrug efflux pump subunit AcrA (membrane-fusion protein)
MSKLKTYMKRNLFILLLSGLVLASCGSSTRKDTAGDLNDKKAKLEKLKKQQQDLNAEITSLQKDLALQDTSSQKAANTKLVAITPVQSAAFTHYVDLQGRIDATNISYVAPPNGQGGIVQALYVKEGDAVRKGQVCWPG